jgi:hypothetical protein
MVVCYISPPVLVCCTNKNLATLRRPIYLFARAHRGGRWQLQIDSCELSLCPFNATNQLHLVRRSKINSYRGCQIFLGSNVPKRKNVRNDRKLYQKATQIIPNCRKIFQMVIKYKNFSFQGPSNLGFLV